MAKRYTQVVILCEDYMHLNFARRYLIQRGLEARRIRGNVAPSGRGAGSQYVLKSYPKEVKAIRSRPHIRAGLVAMIDADNLSIEQRLGQLEKSLVEDGQSGREEAERIGLLAPKRNIETWIFYLLGNPVDEETDYKKRVSPSDLKSSVAAFAEKCPQKAAEISAPSLQHACKELTAFMARGK
jgi:hypothetical protein